MFKRISNTLASHSKSTFSKQHRNELLRQGFAWAVFAVACISFFSSEALAQVQEADGEDSRFGSIYTQPNSSFHPSKIQESFTENDRVAIRNLFEKKYGANPAVQLNQKLGELAQSNPNLASMIAYLRSVELANGSITSEGNRYSYFWKGDLNRDGTLNLIDLALAYAQVTFYDEKSGYSISQLKSDLLAKARAGSGSSYSQEIAELSDAKKRDYLSLGMLGGSEKNDPAQWQDGILGKLLREYLLRLRALSRIQPSQLSRADKAEMARLQSLFYYNLPVNLYAVALSSNYGLISSVEKLLDQVTRTSFAAGGASSSFYRWKHSSEPSLAGFLTSENWKLDTTQTHLPFYALSNTLLVSFENHLLYNAARYFEQLGSLQAGSFLSNLGLLFQQSGVSDLVNPSLFVELSDGSQRLAAALASNQREFWGDAGSYFDLLHKANKAPSEGEFDSEVNELFLKIQRFQYFGSQRNAAQADWKEVGGPRILIAGIGNRFDFSPEEVARINPHGIVDRGSVEANEAQIREIVEALGQRSDALSLSEGLAISPLQAFSSTIAQVRPVLLNQTGSESNSLALFQWLDAFQVHDIGAALIHAQKVMSVSGAGASSLGSRVNPALPLSGSSILKPQDYPFNDLATEVMQDEEIQKKSDSYFSAISLHYAQDEQQTFDRDSARNAIVAFEAAKNESGGVEEFEKMGKELQFVSGAGLVNLKMKIDSKRSQKVKLMEAMKVPGAVMDINDAYSTLKSLSYEIEFMESYQDKVMSDFTGPDLEKRWGTQTIFGARDFRDQFERANANDPSVLKNKAVREEKAAFIASLAYPSEDARVLLRFVYETSNLGALNWDFNHNGIPADPEDQRQVGLAVPWIGYSERR